MRFPRWMMALLAASAVQCAAAAATAPVVRVSGNHLVDGSGRVLQLRGVNVSALEFFPILNHRGPDGGVDSDYWGGQKPDLRAIRAWHANTIRVPLNEQSYLGQTCYLMPPSPGARPPAQRADPLGKYRSVVKSLVDEATALGMYVILDLHKNAPTAEIAGGANRLQICSISSAQQEMADADNSVAFWSAVARDYQGYPNVIFDLFNEPHIDNFERPSGLFVHASAWTILRDGGTGELLYGADQALKQSWKSAGMQSMLDAVRATGAKNVVMAAGVSWAQDTSRWLEFAPVDPAKQLAMSWHAYPKFGSTFGTADYAQPGLGSVAYSWAESVLAAGYPIIIGETGDRSANGTVGAPFLAVLLPWADAHGVSVLGWSWNTWSAASDDLIKDASGTPSDGYGEAFRRWMVNHK